MGIIDDQERRAAAEIERAHPNWLVMWGCYTRVFWAFPRFLTPRGTIVSAPGPDRLLGDMLSVEHGVKASRQVAYGSLQTAASSSLAAPPPLPRRLSRGQPQRGALPWVAPATDARAVVSPRVETSGPSLVPRPSVPPPPVRGTAAAAIPVRGRAAAAIPVRGRAAAAIPVRGRAAAAIPWPSRVRPATRSRDPYAADPYVDPYTADPDEFDPYAADPDEADPWDSGPYDPYQSNSAWQG
jgi:hypothetical protein